MAYSLGFSPHPKVSYANAAPTGVASEAEYVEIGVTVPCDPGRVRAALDSALPDGLDVVDVVEARTPDFVNRLEASVWQIELLGMDSEVVARAAAALMAAPEAQVERLTKNGLRVFDAREPIVAMRVAPPAGPDSDCAILGAVVRHVTPSVRPDDVLAALRRVADLVPPTPARVTRLAQGPLDLVTATVGDPFALDRSA